MAAIVKAVLAEISTLFLTRDLGSGTFPDLSGVDEESIDIRPIYAPIIKEPGSTHEADIGIGVQLTEQPRKLGMGGQLPQREFLLTVTVTVRGSLNDAYPALLTAAEFLASLGGKSGPIGGHEDPMDTQTDEHEIDAMQVLDQGESVQTIDDAGDLTMSRQFSIMLT